MEEDNKTPTIFQQVPSSENQQTRNKRKYETNHFPSVEVKREINNPNESWMILEHAS